MFRTAFIAATMLITGTMAAAQAPGRRVQVNGMLMYYEVSGSGEPLIVLHGAYMNIPMMGEIIPQLAKTHRIYALELQGHGRTTDINRPITYQNLADDVSAFMDAWLAANPNGFRELARKVIALQQEPMAWEADVKALKTPVLIIAGDADGSTLEHNVSLFRLLGGGVMGDMGKPLPASRLAILPATSHTASITQVNLLLPIIEQFLRGETPRGFFGGN